MIEVVVGQALAFEITHRPGEDAEILWVRKNITSVDELVLTPHASDMMIFEMPRDLERVRHRLVNDPKLLRKLLGVGETRVSATVAIHPVRITATRNPLGPGAITIDISMTDEELALCRRSIISKLSPLEIEVASRGL